MVYKHSQETKEKIRQKALGRKMPSTTRNAINKAIKGKPAWNKWKKHFEKIQLLRTQGRGI